MVLNSVLPKIGNTPGTAFNFTGGYLSADTITGSTGSLFNWTAGTLVLDSTVTLQPSSIFGTNLTLGPTKTLSFGPDSNYFSIPFGTTLNIAGGSLTVPGMNVQGTLNFTSGRLQINSGTLNFQNSVPETLAGTVNGTGSVDVPPGSQVTFAGPLSYTGPTYVSGTIILASNLMTTSDIELTGTLKLMPHATINTDVLRIYPGAGTLDLTTNSVTFTTASATFPNL